jgi:hypothetical protein
MRCNERRMTKSDAAGNGCAVFLGLRIADDDAFRYKRRSVS